MADSSEDPAKVVGEPASDAKLAVTVRQASELYGRKSYEQAAELYAEAAEMQAELNGELALENADLLYAYGRCLYHVAVSKSDVLGGKVAGEKARPGGDASKRGLKRKKGQDSSAASAEQSKSDDAPAKSTDKAGSTNTPFFQIEGDDADWSSASSEDGDEDADGEAEADADGADPDGTAADDEDDFATAYEILDVARVLLSRKLESVQTGDDGVAAAASSLEEKKPHLNAEQIRQTKEALADTHDLQSEISLESERFEAAVVDSRASLALKQELYPQESSYVAEAHFKLSLALEFASVTQVKGEEGNEQEQQGTADRNQGVEGVDEQVRKEAAEHMEAAIASTKLRLEKEKAALATMEDGDEKQEKESSVTDVKSMIEEMEQRLSDLRQPAMSFKGMGMDDAGDTVKGLLGSILGESKATQKAAIEEATKGANDLTGLVKRKAKRPEASSEHGTPDATTAVSNGNGKRVAAVMSDANGDGSAPESKKARVEDVAEE